MNITRRDFLRYAGVSACALGLTGLDLKQLDSALAGASSPAVLWLSGSGCTGCSVSLLNAVNPTIDSVLLNTISLKYHPQLMAAAGELAVQSASSAAASGNYMLVVEGAIPTGSSEKFCYVWEEGGRPVTMAEAVRSLAANAQNVVAVGSCASFGGIPKANPAAGVVGLGSFLGRPVINIPGCPANPAWVVGSLVAVLSGSPPALDSNGRPRSYFTSGSIHDRCPRKETEEADRFGQADECLKELGCKGPRTHANCDTARWNNGTSYCIAVNGLCIGCTEPDFPAFPLHRSGSVGGGIELTPEPTNTPQPVQTPDPRAPGYNRTYLPSVLQGD